MKKVLPILIMLLYTLTALGQNIYYVKTDGDDTNDGSSWNNAFASITKAVEVTVGGDEIRVASGTFKEANTISVNKKIITLKGGYDTSTSLQNYNNKTIIDGENNYLILRFQTSTGGATVDNFILQNGNGKVDITGASTGGAVWVQGYCYFSNCIFRNNTTASGGGAIAVDSYNDATVNGPLSIVNCEFYNNASTASSTSQGGGAIRILRRPVYVINSTFSGNKATTGVAGAILVHNSSSTDGALHLKNSIVWGNVDSRESAAIPGVCEIQVSGAFTVTLENNILRGGLSRVLGNGTKTLMNGEETIDANDADPLFTSASDFRISLAASPAVGTGKNSLLPANMTTDINGSARIQEDEIDLGAYESPYRRILTSNSDVLVGKGFSILSRNDYIQIDINSQTDKNELKMYDLSGKTVRDLILPMGTSTINVSDLSNGIYLLNIQNKTEKILIHK